MHFDAFDRYHGNDSFVHRLDPRIKVVVTVGFILSNALLPDGAWIAFGLSWLLLLLANRFSNLGMTFTLKRSFVALPFALVAVTVLFSTLGKPLVSFHFLMWNFTITNIGLMRFITILVRSWLSVQIAILLVATTRFPDIIHALEHLRIPSILTTIIAFLYRYLFVLGDEVFRLMRAREARSAAVAVAVPGQRSGRSAAWHAATPVTSRRPTRMSFVAVITSQPRLRCWQSFFCRWLDDYDERFTSSRSTFCLS